MKVSSVVLHWGEDIGGGSEHTVDGHAAALEVCIYVCLVFNSQSQSLGLSHSALFMYLMYHLWLTTFNILIIIWLCFQISDIL